MVAVRNLMNRFLVADASRSKPLPVYLNLLVYTYKDIYVWIVCGLVVEALVRSWLNPPMILIFPSVVSLWHKRVMGWVRCLVALLPGVIPLPMSLRAFVIASNL